MSARVWTLPICCALAGAVVGCKGGKTDPDSNDSTSAEVGTMTTESSGITTVPTGDGDGDGQPDDLPPMCVETGCSVDLGSRLCDGEPIPCPTGSACAGGMCINDPCAAADLAESSIGCDFWPIKVDINNNAAGACFATFVVNTWSEPVHIDVTREDTEIDVATYAKLPQGQGADLTWADYDPEVGIPPGEVAVIALSREPVDAFPDCPFPAAIQNDAGLDGTGRGSAFHLTTDRPVSAYQMLPFGGGQTAVTSATLLLPSSAWGQNYVLVSASEASLIAADGLPTAHIIAGDEGASVKLLPKVAVVGGNGLPAGPPNAPLEFELAPGEYAQFTQSEELSGAIIEASAPVAVIGGSRCFHNPSNQLGCDSAQQQLMPIDRMGYRYAAVRHRDRLQAMDESPPWRMVGVRDQTQLSYTPAKPEGAPDTLSRGDVVEFATSEPFVVEAQDPEHPFFLAGYMLGGGGIGGEGDPEFYVAVPVGQFLSRYVFLTDPTYPETHLVIVRARDDQGQFQPIDLDCLGEVQGFTTLGDYEYARVDLVRDDFEGVDGCANGRHEMLSEAPFSVIVWGWGSSRSEPSTQWVSYAFPAGLGLGSLNDVYVPVE